ncbi:MAG: arabinan endo-1,5-alpha-L-arabinosidase, partial [Hymenobacter sp.]
MINKSILLAAGLLACGVAQAQTKTKPAAKPAARAAQLSGNPIFPGWYADPDAAIFGSQYWVYPTYSAKYEDQVFLDAFSSPDLVHWTQHPHVLDTAAVKWAHR